MIYTKTSFNERQRILSDNEQRGLKSPARVVRLSTSPTHFYCASPEKPAKILAQPYQYKQTVQQSSNKLAYYAQSPPKLVNTQPVYVNTTVHVSPVSSPSKPMTLRQRLWAKHKHQPVEQYNIWDGHESQVSILEPVSSKHIKFPQTVYNSPTRGFQRKSIMKYVETGAKGQIRRIVSKNETMPTSKPQKYPTLYR